MSTYTDIRYDYNLPSSAGGAMKLISEQTASSSASISFTSGIDSSYRTYMFKFINMHPSDSGVTYGFQTSTNGGSSYGVTCTSTAFAAEHPESDAYAYLNYNTNSDLAQSTSYVKITINSVQGILNDESLSGNLYLFNPSSTTYVKHFMQNSCVNDSTQRNQNMFGAGYFNTTSAINAIRFQFSAGNVDAGTIKMYGIA